MKKIVCMMIGLFSMLSGVARADLSFDSFIYSTTPNQIDSYEFVVAATGDVNLYTSSYASFNPLLTLWMATVANPVTAADWQLVTANDDRAAPNFAETLNAKDAKIEQVLTSGLYMATVTESGNVANGNLLSAGFSNQGAQNSNDYAYTLTIAGNNVVPVPEPSMIWLMMTGLLGFLGWSKKKIGFLG